MKFLTVALLVACVVCSVKSVEITENDSWNLARENVGRIQKFIAEVLRNEDYNPSEAELNSLRIAGPETNPDLESKEPTLRIIKADFSPEAIAADLKVEKL